MADEATEKTPAPQTGEPEKTGTGKIDEGKTEEPKGEAVDPKALQAQKEHFRKKAEEAEKRLAEREAADEEARIAEAKKKEEFETLYETEKQKREAAESRATTIAINAALATKLTAEGCIAPEDAAILVNKESIKVDENGTVTGVDEAIAALKEGKQYLFTEKPKAVNDGSMSPKTDATDATVDTRIWKASELAKMSNDEYAKNRDSIKKAQREGRFRATE